MVSKITLVMIILGIVGVLSIVTGVGMVLASWEEPVESERTVDIAQDLVLAGADSVTIRSRDAVIVRGSSAVPSVRLRGTQVAVPELALPQIVQRETVDGIEIEVVEDYVVGLFGDRVRASEQDLVLEVTLPQQYAGRLIVDGGSDVRVDSIAAQMVSVNGGTIVIHDVSADALDVVSDSWGDISLADVSVGELDAWWESGDLQLTNVRAADARIAGPLERLSMRGSVFDAASFGNGDGGVRTTLSAGSVGVECTAGGGKNILVTARGSGENATLDVGVPRG